MRRFCLQNVESILGDTKKDLPKRTGPFHYIREFIYSSTAACAAAKYSLFIRDSERLCMRFVSQFFEFSLPPSYKDCTYSSYVNIIVN